MRRIVNYATAEVVVATLNRVMEVWGVWMVRVVAMDCAPRESDARSAHAPEEGRRVQSCRTSSQTIRRLSSVRSAAPLGECLCFFVAFSRTFSRASVCSSARTRASTQMAHFIMFARA